MEENKKTVRKYETRKNSIKKDKEIKEERMVRNEGRERE
jgi:hypothetical protein